MESRKWRGQYPRLRLLLNSQWRHGVISGSPAFSSLFGILSVLGADWDGNLRMAFCISSISIVGNATGSGWAVWPMSSRSVFSACRKKDSARHSAFAVCVNTFVPSCRLIYGVKTWYGVARFWIHRTSFHVLRASPIASSLCFRWCCRNVDSQIPYSRAWPNYPSTMPNSFSTATVLFLEFALVNSGPNSQWRQLLSAKMMSEKS